nr:hypothetical protein Q903MT_gene1313 [Picea sitchensis]
MYRLLSPCWCCSFCCAVASFRCRVCMERASYRCRDLSKIWISHNIVVMTSTLYMQFSRRYMDSHVDMASITWIWRV